MNCLSKTNWIPVELSLPNDNREVIIQMQDYPDPTFGCYERGSWSLSDINLIDADITVVAWRDKPDAYNPLASKLVFRDVDEARQITLNAAQQMKSDFYDREFYEIREAILHAYTFGKWLTIVENLSDHNRNGLISAGYGVNYNPEMGYIISWK